MQDEDLERQVGELLRELGITPKMDGYYYLVAATVMVIHEPVRLSQVIKDVYIPLSEKYGVGAYSIEKSIRYAIGTSWAGEGQEPMKLLAGGWLDRRSTNSEFIDLLVEHFGD